MGGVSTLPHGEAAAKLPGTVSPVAIYILAICFIGAVLAGAAFAWAALRGEFTDAEQTAFLVFDDDEEERVAGRAAAARSGHRPSGRER